MDIRHEKTLPPLARLICMDWHDGITSPTKIARLHGVSRTIVYRHLATLRDGGYLSTTVECKAKVSTVVDSPAQKVSTTVEKVSTTVESHENPDIYDNITPPIVPPKGDVCVVDGDAGAMSDVAAVWQKMQEIRMKHRKGARACRLAPHRSALKARLAEHGKEDILRAYLWCWSSSHTRADFLRSGGYLEGFATFLRPKNCAEYVELSALNAPGEELPQVGYLQLFERVTAKQARALGEKYGLAGSDFVAMGEDPRTKEPLYQALGKPLVERGLTTWTALKKTVYDSPLEASHPGYMANPPAFQKGFKMQAQA